MSLTEAVLKLLQLFDKKKIQGNLPRDARGFGMELNKTNKMN